MTKENQPTMSTDKSPGVGAPAAPAPPRPESLAAKMARIYRDVPRFAKSAQVTGGGPSFGYTPIEDIADWLRVAMGNEGIVMVPESIETIAQEQAGVTKNGAPRWRYVLLVHWRIADGRESLNVTSMGEAIDSGDKGANKAQTAARKYALLGAFHLSTGADDPDARHPDAPKPPAEVAGERRREVEALADGTDINIREFMTGIGITTPEALADEATYRLALSEMAAEVARRKAPKDEAPAPADAASGSDDAPAEDPGDDAPPSGHEDRVKHLKTMAPGTVIKGVMAINGWAPEDMADDDTYAKAVAVLTRAKVNGAPLTETQMKGIHAHARDNNMDHDAMKALALELWPGIESTKEIPKDAVPSFRDAIVAAAKMRAGGES